MTRRMLIGVAAFFLALIVFLVAEVLFIKYNGIRVSVPTIPRSAQTLGTGPKLNFVVMGDSTSVAEGAEYKNSYAVAAANHLAKKYSVNWINVGISGATVKSVLDVQLPKAMKQEPDLVLLAVGANDVTHFTSGKSIQTNLQQIIDGLKEANPQVRIVVTGSPAMDSVTRFPFPAKQLMGLRTRQVNQAFKPIIEKNNLTVAPIAEKTREPFLKDPTLLASDKFHPNDRGYALWIPVVNEALDRALK